MGEAGRAPRAGQQTRLADIPADAGAGLGCFEALHDYASGHEFAQAIGRAVGLYYGTPLAAFLARLMAERGEGLWRQLREGIRRFERDALAAYGDPGGQARRVAARFGLVAAAGDLAIRWLELPWQAGAASQAAEKMFAAWLESRGGAGNQEDVAMLAQVRDFLSRHGEARFTDWERPVAEDDHAPRVINRAGFRRAIIHRTETPDGVKVDRETEYFIFPEPWKNEVCKGHDPRAVARLLVRLGHMEQGGPEHAAKAITLPGEGRRRVYHVLPSVWAGEQ
jgi:uncharacterized protein (DUF927 family)